MTKDELKKSMPIEIRRMWMDLATIYSNALSVISMDNGWETMEQVENFAESMKDKLLETAKRHLSAMDREMLVNAAAQWVSKEVCNQMREIVLDAAISGKDPAEVIARGIRNGEELI